MENKDNNILKSNIIFGGAQIVQMLATILRAKLIAVFLFSTGLGLNAIFQSILLTINNVTSCGIMQSGVREISNANVNDTPDRLAKILGIFKKLLLLSSCLGLIICIILSPVLSFFSFGNTSYVLSFALLGFGVAFYTLTHGEMTILQGTRNITGLAKGTILGAMLSVIICVPCYYFLGINGVLVSIIIGYLSSWLMYLIQVRKQNLYFPKVSFKEAVILGRPIIVLGVVLMLGTFLVSFFSYLTNVLIRYLGSIEDVGYYQGAASITTQSILVVTSVLASDFFPRLSALVFNVKEHNKLINLQLEIIIWVIAPISVIIICLADYIIPILLSSEFLVIKPMLQAMSCALLFRGIWITMSYIILAHGDRTSYLLYDGLLGNGLNFLLNILGFYFGGLSGIGYSFVFTSILVCLILFYIVVKLYKYKIDKEVVFTIVTVVPLIFISYFLSKFNFLYCCIWCVIVVITSIYRLNKKFGIINFSYRKRF